MVNLQIEFPDFSGELLVNMFIQKAEEEALRIDQNTTEKYRRDNQIPDSDGSMITKIRDNVHQFI
jgi:hypothetical protein